MRIRVFGRHGIFHGDEDAQPPFLTVYRVMRGGLNGVSLYSTVFAIGSILPLRQWQITSEAPVHEREIPQVLWPSKRPQW